MVLGVAVKVAFGPDDQHLHGGAEEMGTPGLFRAGCFSDLKIFAEMELHRAGGQALVLLAGGKHVGQVGWSHPASYGAVSKSFVCLGAL